jgi:hypothetical protein
MAGVMTAGRPAAAAAAVASPVLEGAASERQPSSTSLPYQAQAADVIATATPAAAAAAAAVGVQAEERCRGAECCPGPGQAAGAGDVGC